MTLKKESVAITRRQFIITSALVAGGLGMQMMPLSAIATSGNNDTSNVFSPWLTILPDDSIIVTVPSPEIGNGVATQHAMNIAEELACDWNRVQIKFANYRTELEHPGSFAAGLQPFFGGHSTDHERMPFGMQLGASARERLKVAAAQKWGVKSQEIIAKDSILSHPESGRTLRYGDVAAHAASVVLDHEPQLKNPNEWTLIGKSNASKLNQPDIVTGKAMFGMDVSLPNMVYAALQQSPVHGGEVKSFHVESVINMPGVRAVFSLPPAEKDMDQTGHPTFGFDNTERRAAVVVIADHYWQAKKALDALPIEWDDGLGAFWDSNEKLYQRQNDLLASENGSILAKTGNVDAVKGDQTIDVIYRTPFCDHAVMEPLNGTAWFKDGSLEFWHPSQDMQQAFWVAVNESGLAAENVTHHQTYVGGGFGRRTSGDDVRMVIAIAQRYQGVPVKVIWSREETTRQGSYRTAIATRFKATLGEDGLPLSLQGWTSYSGLSLNIGFTDMVYVAAGNIPNTRLTSTNLPTHVRTGAYRGPCYNSHIFNIEGFIDECALSADIDPLEYRLKLVSGWDPAWVKCLNVVAEKSGWGTPLPAGQGRGVAIGNWPSSGQKYAGSTVCAIAHVEVSNNGVLKVLRIDFSFDCGRIANRNAVLAQLQGGIVYGLNMALNEGLTLHNGAIVEQNFSQMPMIRMADMPEIHIHFDALSGHERFAIIGEAPVGPIGPAIANAIFQATGKRIRSTPFRLHDLSWS
jgi:isoquinoline 1-oxidoreductase beta subunit